MKGKEVYADVILDNKEFPNCHIEDNYELVGIYLREERVAFERTTHDIGKSKVNVFRPTKREDFPVIWAPTQRRPLYEKEGEVVARVFARGQDKILSPETFLEVSQFLWPYFIGTSLHSRNNHNPKVPHKNIGLYYLIGDIRTSKDLLWSLEEFKQQCFMEDIKVA